MDIGDEVFVRVRDGKIIIQKANEGRRRTRVLKPTFYASGFARSASEPLSAHGREAPFDTVRGTEGFALGLVWTKRAARSAFGFARGTTCWTATADCLSNSRELDFLSTRAD